jgi:Spy/CpxP family protein refolding chaperone
MWKVIVATLVIFGTGVITGGLLVNYTSRSAASPPVPPATPSAAPVGMQNPGRAPNRMPPPMAGPLRKDFLDRMEQELQLTVAQKERIEKIISDGQDQTRQIWQQIEPQMRQKMMQARIQIRRELTAEQQARFEEMMRRPRDPRRPVIPRENPASLPANQN